MFDLLESARNWPAAVQKPGIALAQLRAPRDTFLRGLRGAGHRNGHHGGDDANQPYSRFYNDLPGYDI